MIHWCKMDHSLGSSSAGVWKDKSRSFLSIAPNQCERTHPHLVWRDLEHFISWNVLSSASSSQNDAGSSIGQGKWKFIPKSDRVIDSCYLVSKKMTNLLRHRLELREPDGAVAREKLLIHFQRSMKIQTAGARNNGPIA